MYCDEATSPKRLASQVVFYAALEVLLRAVGPIVPHLTEEVCQHHVCLKGLLCPRRSLFFFFFFW